VDSKDFCDYCCIRYIILLGIPSSIFFSARCALALSLSLSLSLFAVNPLVVCFSLFFVFIMILFISPVLTWFLNRLTILLSLSNILVCVLSAFIFVLTSFDRFMPPK